jgi:hypothetical protein
MQTDTGLDELRELHRRAGKLIDPQCDGIGMFSWKIMLSDLLLEMACYAGHGMAPKAAPDLLAACELFLTYDGENCQTGKTTYDDVLTAIRAAVRAAKGE